MKINDRLYYVYILANKAKTVLYTGMTNDLEQRLVEHYIDRIEKKTFTGKYNCHFLLFYENYQYVNDAIAREKEIKGWLRIKKINLITSFNPDWKFLNDELLGEWPPKEVYHRKND
ncbi:MAG: GIY-YIG nuclease family protein [Ferruginibacter sp.]